MEKCGEMCGHALRRRGTKRTGERFCVGQSPLPRL